MPNLNEVQQYIRDIPQNAQSQAYALAKSDVGKHISISSGGVTVPAGVFAEGDAISIYNNSGNDQSVVQANGITMYLAGTSTTGTRTLAERGVCTVLCVGVNTFVIIGSGLT
jgi:hypothetical protein